jgi:exodeoxyribonuclease VII large subunit
MSKKVKSQWDFGELFPPEATRKVLAVSELTWQIRRLLEEKVGRVWVSGEVTNLRFQSSGHIYFTLKDASAQLSCVLFRGETKADRALLAEGHKVLAEGEVTVYEPRGQYQLRVTQLEARGVGALQVAFEKLKRKLEAEGLFARERKRALPPYPQRIGLVTSPTGAAIQDILHVVGRRNPGLKMILARCRVQGEGAAAEIAAGIRLLNEFHRSRLGDGEGAGLDLILVTRGGGSLEDLWAFNEEAVARAIFESELPVVSAVGHEIDFTISDFVADVRAATPSAAAEIITEGVFSSGQFLAEAASRIRRLIERQLEDKHDGLGRLTGRLARAHPRRRLEAQSQRLDDLQSGLARGVGRGLRRQSVTLRSLADRLARARPALAIGRRREALALAARRFHAQGLRRVRERRQRLDALVARLRLLGPEQVLARGYSITTDLASGKVLRDAAELKAGRRIKTRLQQGEVISEVK